MSEEPRKSMYGGKLEGGSRFKPLEAPIQSMLEKYGVDVRVQKAILATLEKTGEMFPEATDKQLEELAQAGAQAFGETKSEPVTQRKLRDLPAAESMPKP